jgi:hypothetical protein
MKQKLTQKKSFTLLVILSIGLIILLFQFFHQQILRGRAATSQLETEIATLVGSVIKGADTSASGGQYLQFGSGTAPTTVPTVSAGDPVLAAAGDMVCGSTTSTTLPCKYKETANIITQINPTAVLTLGDNQYDSGALADFQNYYNPSWGVFKSKTHPVIGNHEGGEGGSSAGYFDYFNGVGQATGPAGDRSKGYYSFDLGAWHIIVLNGNCGTFSFNGSSTGCVTGSAQETWLKQDLAAHPSRCTLAAWHEPYFSSGHDGGSPTVVTYTPFWNALYAAGADVVLSGHSHDYERFNLQNPTGGLDTAKGIRQFVVGTGGRDFTGWRTTLPNSQVRNNTTFGVLKMTLHPTSYDWQFVPIAGSTFTDSGTQACH